MENTRKHHGIKNSNKIVIGILKKHSLVNREEPRANSTPKTPKFPLNLTSFERYNIKPGDYLLQKDAYVEVQKLSEEDITRKLRLSEFAREVREAKKQNEFFRMDYNKTPSVVPMLQQLQSSTPSSIYQETGTV